MVKKSKPTGAAAWNSDELQAAHKAVFDRAKAHLETTTDEHAYRGYHPKNRRIARSFFGTVRKALSFAQRPTSHSKRDMQRQLRRHGSKNGFPNRIWQGSCVVLLALLTPLGKQHRDAFSHARLNFPVLCEEFPAMPSRILRQTTRTSFLLRPLVRRWRILKATFLQLRGIILGVDPATIAPCGPVIVKLWSIRTGGRP